MNPNEHHLMIFMLARQRRMITILMEIMKSRGVLEPGDFEAFASMVSGEVSAQLLGETREEYWRAAKALEKGDPSFQA